MGICFILGGSKLLPGWFGGTYAVEIEVQIKTFVKDCQDSSDFTNLVKSVECGGGNRYLGNAQIILRWVFPKSERVMHIKGSPPLNVLSNVGKSSAGAAASFRLCFTTAAHGRKVKQCPCQMFH